MQPKNESFEKAQARAIGMPPKSGSNLLSRLKKLNWWKVLRSSFVATLFLGLALRRVLEGIEAPSYMAGGFYLAIFAFTALIFLVIELDPLATEDDDT